MWASSFRCFALTVTLLCTLYTPFLDVFSYNVSFSQSICFMSIIPPWHHHAAAAAHLWCESPIPSHEMMLMTAEVRLTTVNLLSCCKKPVWDVFNFVAWGVILPTLLTQDRMVPCFHVETHRTRQHLLQCLVTPCAFRDAPLHTLIVTSGC